MKQSVAALAAIVSVSRADGAVHALQRNARKEEATRDQSAQGFLEAITTHGRAMLLAYLALLSHYHPTHVLVRMSAITRHPAFVAYQRDVLQKEHEWEGVRRYAHDTPLATLVKAQRDKHEVKQLQALAQYHTQELEAERRRNAELQQRLEEALRQLGAAPVVPEARTQPPPPPTSTPVPVPPSITPQDATLLLYEEFANAPLVLEVGLVYFGKKWAAALSVHGIESDPGKKKVAVPGSWRTANKNLIYKRFLLMRVALKVSKMRAEEERSVWEPGMGMDVVHDLEAGFKGHFQGNETKLEDHLRSRKKEGQWCQLDAEFRVWGGRATAPAP